VDVDLSGLEFISSSCLKAFVTWITTVQQMPDCRYQISFLFKPSRAWQQKSIGPLARLGEDIVTTRRQDE
jgi:hypothetical protein